jgi:uncharacterized protein (TIGR00661 family)
MKILYGIQGTGHGHISRAREILPVLSNRADIDVLISGYNCNMNLQDITVTQKRGISLTYDSEGSVSCLKTAFNLKPVTFIRDIHSLDIKQYGLVISDFEPVTAWAAHRRSVFSIGLSHQASFLSPKPPRPSRRSLAGEQILRHFAPCRKPIGFHFQRYDSFILPPIIRRDVRSLSTKKGPHVTVYLPAFDHQFLAQQFKQIPEVEWHVFSPECKELYEIENVLIHPVGNIPFIDSMKSSFGVITGAGFETCAEAMFLGKKLLAIPISNQYEQYCNAAALHKMGVQTTRTIDHTFIDLARDWIRNTKPVQLEEIADTSKLADMMIQLAQNHEGDFSSEQLLEVQDAEAYTAVSEITE